MDCFCTAKNNCKWKTLEASNIQITNSSYIKNKVNKPHCIKHYTKVERKGNAIKSFWRQSFPSEIHSNKKIHPKATSLQVCKHDSHNLYSYWATKHITCTFCRCELKVIGLSWQSLPWSCIRVIEGMHLRSWNPLG